MEIKNRYGRVMDDMLQGRLDECREQLLAERSKRVRMNEEGKVEEKTMENEEVMEVDTVSKTSKKRKRKNKGKKEENVKALLWNVSKYTKICTKR